MRHLDHRGALHEAEMVSEGHPYSGLGKNILGFLRDEGAEGRVQNLPNTAEVLKVTKDPE